MLATLLSNFNTNPHNSNGVLCKLYFYLFYVFSTLTPTVLILASIDRLLISSQNVDTRLYSSKRLAYFSISICTSFWLIFYFHVLIKVSLQASYPSIFCYYDLAQDYRRFVAYSSLVVNVFLCVAMIVLCILTFKNVRRIRAVPRRQRRQIRTMTKKDFQLLRCLFAQDIIYIIFSIGLSACTIYQGITISQMRPQLEQAIGNFFNSLTVLLHHIPFCASFYIFVVVSKSFRNECKRIVYKICGKDITLSQEEENRQENVGRENIELNVVTSVDRVVLSN